MQARRELSQSLSFNSYSNKNLAEIADRVVEEFKVENGTREDFFIDDSGGFSCNENEKEQGNADDDEFEFSFIKESEISPVAADEIFYNGQIRPIYPILFSNNNDIMNGSSNSNTTSDVEDACARPKTIRFPLRKLFLEEEREANSSCSSSEADDLESIPAGTYCVWRPKETEKPDGSCKKSNSTGSSKRWKFRDLLHRSNSDGKDTFVFLTPLKKKENKAEKKTDNNAPKVSAMHNYVKNGGEKRKTYLPYRQDLVGFFSTPSVSDSPDQYLGEKI
ncbi:hypothetical protein RND71_017596 [Anisodus tanguticus]|uniref:Uncharacterized protein n=1 Tax=Anisodus tanguticus TaxID=243964 RepID=A0AAE1S2P5_9SOLA|nr:hypothetical protein RND71_017596 [Anisodus tanguticus]